MGSVGTPIIAVESGVVGRSAGTNTADGALVSVRSTECAITTTPTCVKTAPITPRLKLEKTVTAGDVIGYLGMSGYSTKKTQIISMSPPPLWSAIDFDESQKDSNNEIWIDLYDFVEFLQKNKSAVEKDDTKEFHRVYQMRDPAATNKIKKPVHLHRFFSAQLNFGCDTST